ncbi:protein kinase [bacterium]|nr:protein kinase [bacterium]
MALPKVFRNRFETGDLIVERPSAHIYKGYDRELGRRELAIKIYVEKPQDDPALIKEFENEVELLKRCTHETLVPILAGGAEDGVFFIAMEYIEGVTLKDLLKDNPSGFDLPRALGIVKDLADGLAELHSQGAVHGHLDSRAIIFKAQIPRISGYYPRVIEKIHKMLTSDSRLIVDPAYISPEQVTAPDKIDARADIYALGVLAFEIMTGQKPFTSNNPLQLAMKHVQDKIPSPAKINANISPLVDAAVMRALSKNPAERFSNCAEFIDALSGGKGMVKNPFAGLTPETLVEGLGDVSQTMPVSMSVETIQKILSTHAPKREQVEDDSSSTLMGRAAVKDTQPVTDSDEMAQTAIGMQAVGQKKQASLVQLTGKDKGKKFTLSQQQSIGGRDQSCAIPLSESAMPMRAFIITERNNHYFLSSFGTTGVTVNGHQLEDEQEHQLQRGDMISVGVIDLRFVAPGEVFTFKEDVADRVIDRPPSKLPQVFVALGVVFLLLSGGGVYYYLHNADIAKSKKEAENRKKAKERDELMAKLKTEGDTFLKEGALIEPPGANAKERFRAVLELSENDGYAKRRLQEIDERLLVLDESKRRRQELDQKIGNMLADGERYFQAGDYISPPGRNAKEVFEAVLKIDSTHQQAQARLKEIGNILSDLSGKIEELLKKAQLHIDQNEIVQPAGANALEALQQVLKVQPQNTIAKNALYDLAAQQVFLGDQAKAQANAGQMRQFYLTAQALGVDPKYLEPRLQGAQLMEKSRASVIIYQRGNQAATTKEEGPSTYLPTQEIDRRVAERSLASNSQRGQGGRVFIDLSRLGK